MLDEFALALLRAQKYQKLGKFSNGAVVNLADDLRLSSRKYEEGNI
jgi:hypothetical protein